MDTVPNAAAAIAVAGFAVSSAQALYQTIDHLKNAPNSIMDNLLAVQRVIETLREIIKDDNNLTLKGRIQRINIESVLKAALSSVETSQLVSRNTRSIQTKRDLANAIS